MLFPGTRMGMYLMDLDMFHGSSCCIVRYCKWVHRVPVITCHNHILRRNTLVITLVWRMTRRRRFGHWIFGLDIGPSLEKKNPCNICSHGTSWFSQSTFATHLFPRPDSWSDVKRSSVEKSLLHNADMMFTSETQTCRAALACLVVFQASMGMRKRRKPAPASC